MLQRRTARFACRCAVHCCRTNGKIYLKPERTINGNNHGWYKGLAFAVIPPPPSASSWWRNILSHCLPISSLPTYLADLKPLGKSIPTAAETLHPTLFTSKCFIIRYIRNVGSEGTLHSVTYRLSTSKTQIMQGVGCCASWRIYIQCEDILFVDEV